MHFRYARHTIDLEKIKNFYTEVVGLDVLGSFQNHDGYDGIFLGYPSADWHLEFTTSNHQPSQSFDEDDILVFYVHSRVEMQAVKSKIHQVNIRLETARNPYWQLNGIMISDPDGYKIAFSIKERLLKSDDQLTTLVINKGLNTWNELLEYTRNLPYGRNANRSDLSLIVLENKGTCSSKHAFLKKIAEENDFQQVKLILGMYRMNNVNTAKIGSVLSSKGLSYLPEAHCYLKIDNRRVDITNSNSDISTWEGDILEEFEISAEQVNTFKVEYHQSYLRKWIIDNNIPFDFESIWNIREECIKNLEA